MENILIKQHNAITSARYSWPSAAKNILYYAMKDLKDDDPINKVYKVHVRELEKIMNTELKYRQLKEATNKLISRVYTINESAKNEILHISLLASARYKKGTGIIELKFSKNVRSYLFQLKNNFTSFQLNMALNLKSKYSKRIYEMLCQWKDTGIMKITIEELKYRLGLIDTETRKEQYLNFNHFEKRILLIAQQELQNITDLSFTYTTKKTGVKVTDLVFLIKYKAKKELAEHKIKDPSIEEIRNRLVSKFKLSEWQIQIILQAVSKQEIHKTLYDINLKLADGKIKNVGGFTAKIFDNKYNLGLFHKKQN